MEEHLYDELLVELECPICTNYMSPPIRQCATGHSVCESCRKKLPKCALCQTKFTESRNLSLEGLAVKMRYPCINKPSGCNVRLSYTERETHELRCSLKTFKCAMDKCPWTGKLEDIAAHWASKKMSSKPYHKNNVCHTKMKTESYYVNMVEAYNKLFWFKCKLTKNKLYWAVQYIGNSAESENYCYEIEIFKPGKAKKKIVLSDYCQAIELENSQLFSDEACMTINADSVSTFVSADQILIYYFRMGVAKEDQVLPIPPLIPISQGQVKQDMQKMNENKGGKQRDRSKGPPHANKDQKKKYYNPQKNQQKKDGFVML